MIPPKLSIIIPVYNKGKYLEKCLTSLIRQSYDCFEIIIINDGSTDNSEEIAKRFQVLDGRIKLYTYTNAGVSVARNRGLKNAQGEYIMFIDADDWIESDYLSHVIKAVKQHEADLYVWGITKHDDRGNHVICPLLNGVLNKIEFLSAFVKEQYVTKKGLYGYISNKLLRRKIIQENNIQFDDKIKQLEDYDFFLSYYDCIEKVCIFNESGYHYVTGTDFSSGMMIKEVNFLFMIEIHVKCRNLLMRNQCLTRENQQMIDNAICGLALAMFLEIPKVNIRNITNLLRQLENYKEVYGSLKNYDTSFKQLKFFILRKSVLLLYIYLCIWKSYLYFKRIR